MSHRLELLPHAKFAKPTIAARAFEESCGTTTLPVVTVWKTRPVVGDILNGIRDAIRACHYQ